MSSAPSQTQKPDQPTVNVLVVDDQQPFRDAARAVVERLKGFEIIAESESGEDAVVKVDELQPDIVLMDINMGGIEEIGRAHV